MNIVERHDSPDKLLSLVVGLSDDGDWSVGFDGYAWHTHGDILTWDYGGTPESAVRAFVADVIESRRIIVILRAEGAIEDAWVSDNPSRDETEYLDENESIEKRFWNGRAAGL